MKVIITKPNETIETFTPPLCVETGSSRTIPRAQLQRNLFFFYNRQSEGISNMLQILNLLALSNNIANQTCIPVAGAHFGKSKTFIYTVKEDKILERWLITPDGKKSDLTIVTETKYVCFLHLQ